MASNKFHIHKQSFQAKESNVFDIVLPPDARLINGIMVKAYNRDHYTLLEQKTEYSQYIGPTYGFRNEIFGTSAEILPGDITDYLDAFNNLPSYFKNEMKTGEYAIIDFVINKWKNLPKGENDVLQDAVTLYETEIRKDARQEVDSYYISLYINNTLCTNDEFLQNWKNRLYTIVDVEIPLGLPGTFRLKNVMKIFEIMAKTITNLYTQDGISFPLYYQSLTETDCENIPTSINENIKLFSVLQSEFENKVESLVIYPFLDYMRTTPNMFEWEVYISDVYSAYPNIDDNINSIIDAVNAYSEYQNQIEIFFNTIVNNIIQLNPRITPPNILYDQHIVGNITILSEAGYEIQIRDYPVQINDNKVGVRTDLIKVNIPVFVGSQARAVFKNNETYDDGFTIDIYFQYTK
jgi:hypothetical protein